MTIQDIFNAVLAFDEATVVAQTQEQIDAGTSTKTIIDGAPLTQTD